MFTREIIPVYGEMALTVYKFFRDEISSREELIPVRDDISSRDEKKKKRPVNTSSQDEILK